MIREDGKAQNNVKITESLFTEFLGSRLNIDRLASLDSFNQVCQHMGANDPSGVVRVMNAFLVGIRDRKQSLVLMQACQPFLVLLMSNDFFNPLLMALQTVNDPA